MIRIGMLGTNTSHAAVFAGLLNGEPAGPGGPGGPAEPRVAGGRVVAVWSSGREGLSGMHLGAAELADRYGIDRVVDDPGRLVGEVDAVLVLDDLGGGELHADLAEPYVVAGVPTFVDKPMALDLAAAARLFELAGQHGTPLLSCSALRFARELDGVAGSAGSAGSTGSAGSAGRLSSVVSVGPGDWYNYGVHAVEAAQVVSGPGAAWVHRYATDQRDVAVVGRDGDGPTVVVETLRDAAYGFHVVAYGSEGMAQASVRDAAGFYAGTMAAVLEMVRTGRSPVRPAETLEILAVLAAGERSAETGGPVRIDDLGVPIR